MSGTIANAEAHRTVANLVELARCRFNDGVRFERVKPSFVAKDGDPRGERGGGPGYAIRDELDRLWYSRAAVSMAHSGPVTSGIHRFIRRPPPPRFGSHYTVFGRVVAGFDAFNPLVQGNRIRTVSLQ